MYGLDIGQQYYALACLRDDTVSSAPRENRTALRIPREGRAKRRELSESGDMLHLPSRYM